MISCFVNRWRNALKQLRWRGPLRFSLLVLRELLSPLLYWYVLYVFERDIELPQPRENSDFEIKLYAGRDDVERLQREIAPMGDISPEVIESRLSAGDVVVVAYACSQPAGYAWMTSSGFPIVFNTGWVLHATQCVFDGSFTHPSWRGQGIQGLLDTALTYYAHQNGFSRVFFTISALNAAMLQTAKDTRRRKIMTLVLVRVRGLNWVYRKAFGAPFESCFAVSLKSEKPRPVSAEQPSETSTSEKLAS